MLTDFALQAELFAVGRQQQLNRCGVKTDPVVEGLHLMFRVDALNRHHRHQDVFLFDQARVTGKQRFDKEWLVGNDNIVNPGARNIDARQVAFVVHQFIHLRNHNPVVEGRGFHQCRSIFGARPGVEVAFAVCFKPRNQRHVGREVDVEA